MMRQTFHTLSLVLNLVNIDLTQFVLVPSRIERQFTDGILALHLLPKIMLNLFYNMPKNSFIDRKRENVTRSNTHRYFWHLVNNEKKLNLHLYQLPVFSRLLQRNYPTSSLHLVMSALPSFAIPGLPICYSNGLSIICYVHDVSCPCPCFSLNHAQNVFNFGLPLNPEVLYLSLHIMLINIISFPFWAFWNFRSRTFVSLPIPDPYVRTSRMHWLFTFLFNDCWRFTFITICCLPKTFHPIPILLLFICHVLDMHQFFVLSKCILGYFSTSSYILFSWSSILLLNITLVFFVFIFKETFCLSLCNFKFICCSSYVDSPIRTLLSANLRLFRYSSIPEFLPIPSPSS